MMNFTENERKALNIICADCDEIDGYGYTTTNDAVAALIKGTKWDGYVIGAVITNLQKKGAISIEHDRDRTSIWVERDAMLDAGFITHEEYEGYTSR